jgi:UDP-2,3-diacylglucosamine pyrophosphatase LpxH
MGRRYLVVSDLHLADVEDHPDGWKAYKGSRYVFDDAFDALIDKFVEDADDGDRLTVVLNGDIVDFDVVTATPENPPWPVSRFERLRGLKATAEKAIWKLELVLSHHRRLVRALARFVAAGHRLVYVLGNHDREFHFPGVQQALIRALERAASEQGLSLATGTVRFEPWFFYVRDRLYVEHGHQYDLYTSYRYQLSPTVTLKGEECLALPMGNLSNRYLMTRMGFFNPHASDYILNVYRYVTHWVRHYMFSWRGMLVHWLWGSILVILMVLRNKRRLRESRSDHEKYLQRVAQHHDLNQQELVALAQLQPKPIASRVFRLFRELWFDRVLICLLMTGGTVVLALVPIPLWIKLMVPLTCFPLVYFIYEELARGETIFALERAIPERAREVAGILPARVVAFGHTHSPRQIPLSRETVFVDTGTWAPIMDKHNPGELKPGLRNYLVVAFHRNDVKVEYGSWTDAGPAPQN